jgi:hypothetical protein
MPDLFRNGMIQEGYMQQAAVFCLAKAKVACPLVVVLL